MEGHNFITLHSNSNLVTKVTTTSTTEKIMSSGYRPLNDSQ